MATESRVRRSGSTNGARHRSTPRTLEYGQFFSWSGVQRNLPGFRLGCHTARRAPDDIPEHTHATAHVVYVLSGEYVSGATALEPGRKPALIYNPPATTHRDTFDGQLGTFLTLSVSDARLASLGIGACLSAAISWSSGLAVRRARRLVRLCAAWPPRSTGRAEAECVEFLRALCDQASRPRPPAWLESLHAHLSTDDDRRFTIHALAAAAGVHPVHAIRAFQRFYGCTPAAFARRQRLAAAAAALRESDEPIVEIALAAGFADQSHFTRAFSSAFASSPARYRRASRTSGAKSG